MTSEVESCGAPVTVREVTKRFGGFTALDDVTLHFPAGEFVTLLGPSGCGKTTLLRLIGGFDQPTSGEVRVGGAPVEGPSGQLTRMVFQNYALFPHMNARKNVEFGLRSMRVPKSDARKQAMDALELVGIADKATSLPAQMSGGQRQRVALARSLVTQPAVLLLDEPMGALDLQLRKRMQVELRRLHREVGTSFVFVTHDQGEALALSDRIIVMRSGRVIQEGTPAEVFDNPRDSYVAGFIGDANLTRGTVKTSEESALEVETPWGVLKGIWSGDLGRVAHPGDEVAVSVRPSDIRVGSKSSNPSLQGAVVDREYFGGGYRLTVDVGHGQSLSVETRDATKMEGDRVDLWWPEQALRIMPP